MEEEIEELKQAIVLLRGFVDEEYFHLMVEGARSNNRETLYESDSTPDTDEYLYNRIMSVWKESE